jgi:beta-galactosidase
MTFYYGADYYPEHWPHERWDTDAKMMQAAGFNVVRMAEFAWVKLEPRPGEFDFAWLDEAIDLLAAHGIQTVLGTPTASPPAWLMMADETQFLVSADGVRSTYGARREYCPTHEGYRAASDRIVAAMADHYADHPHVIAFQTDNEFGDNCFCDLCQAAFQRWLQDKYGSLDVLNEAWGTIFWSHTYQKWEEIPAMRSTAMAHNPGLQLDWKRFMSDTYVDFQQRQIDILRAKAPGKLITHNLMGFGYDKINYFDLTAPLDFTAWDNYLRVFWSDKSKVDISHMALGHDTMRSTKQAPFWVMEQQSGPTGWSTIAEAPRPGELRAWAYQGIAHGADGMVFFRWRSCRFGTEEYWHGVLDHHGEATRRYHEVAQMGQELAQFGSLVAGSMPVAETAMLLSYDARFGFQSQPNNPGFHYNKHFHDLYRGLWQRNVAVDIVSEQEQHLSKYKLVIVPALYVLSEETAHTLAEYVRGGGTLLVTARSGVKGLANEVVDTRLPGLLREVCGVRVEEYDSMKPDQHNRVIFDVEPIKGKEAELRVWAEWLEPEGAQSIAHYGEDYLAGQSVITINEFGAGKAVYTGVWGDSELFDTLYQWLLPLTGVDGIAAPQGVEVVQRKQGGQTFSFVINHSQESRHFIIGEETQELISGKAIKGEIILPPLEVLVLQHN